MSESNNTVSPLRQRMIDDMTMRKFSAKTQTGYIRIVKNFAEFFGRSPHRADGRGFTPISVAPGQAGHFEHQHQCRHFRTEVFLWHDARAPRCDG